MKNGSLIKVFFAIIAGVIAGFMTGKESVFFGIPYVKIFNLIGTLFLNALTLVVVPLVISSLITGISRLGAKENVGKLGSRTLFYFFLTSFVAVAIGFTVTLFLAPGEAMNYEMIAKKAQTPSSLSQETQKSVHAVVQGSLFDRFEEILYRVIPSNFIAAASQGQLLGLIGFSLLFGFFIPRIDHRLSEAMILFWNGAFQVMMRMTQAVMRALPLGVFGLMAKAVATMNEGAFQSVALFFFAVLGSLVLHLAVALPLFLRLRGISPINHFRCLFPALVAAFTTSSSAATLPITLECMEKKAGVPNRICSFVLPLGASLNLIGSALYVTSGAIFLAQAYQIELHAGVLLPIFLMGLLSSFGMVAGIPSASLVALLIVLQTIGVPNEAIALILPVDRILDMCRTAVSVFNHASCAALVNRSMH